LNNLLALQVVILVFLEGVHVLLPGKGLMVIFSGSHQDHAGFINYAVYAIVQSKRFDSHAHYENLMWWVMRHGIEGVSA